MTLDSRVFPRAPGRLFQASVSPDLTLGSVAISAFTRVFDALWQRVSKGEVAWMSQQRGHPILRDASLCDAPQDEVGEGAGSSLKQ